MTDLFALRDLEPPMGDTATRPALATTRALWTAARADEDGAPPRRIVHARVLQLHATADIARLGLRRARGYHTCGSLADLDFVTAFDVRVWDGRAWETVLTVTDAPDPGDETVWFDLPPRRASAVAVEVRRCGGDGWWPSWNLVSGALTLHAASGEPVTAPRDERLLRFVGDVGDGMEDGEIRADAPGIAVAFARSRAALTHLALDADGRFGGAAGREGGPAPNLLRTAPGVVFQGPTLAPVGAAPVLATALRWAADGTAEAVPGGVRYAVEAAGQRYTLTWTLGEDGDLTLHAVREAEAEMRAHVSSAWTLALDPRVTPAHVVGALWSEVDGDGLARARCAETGLVVAPFWLDVPRMGRLRVTASGDVLARCDVDRPGDRTTLEIKVGERPQPEGDYVLPAGRFEATVTFRLATLDVPLGGAAPEAVRAAVARCALTALTYRPDTATLTNNGASMHCPLSMDAWTATATRLPSVLGLPPGEGEPAFDALDVVRTSLERWLHGAPGYASGTLVRGGRRHAVEDEYLMTGAAALLGLADYLDARAARDPSGARAWLAAHARPVAAALAAMHARDLDGDGLVESPYRTGVSGTGQWSTNWFDVISFGYKDAFSNALLHPALVRLDALVRDLGAPDLATLTGIDDAGGDTLADWAARLRRSYAPAFLNPETGWIAGWRCADGHLHDHAFLCVERRRGHRRPPRRRSRARRDGAPARRAPPHAAPRRRPRPPRNALAPPRRRPRRHPAGLPARLLPERRPHARPGAPLRRRPLRGGDDGGGRRPPRTPLRGPRRRARLRRRPLGPRLALPRRPPVRLRRPPHRPVRRRRPRPRTVGRRRSRP